MASTSRQGTFVPGTKVQVGKHRVIVEKYLSEGGFAHVYVVRVPRSGGKLDIAVLKRVAVPDKETLANMRTEVETLKRLKGHKHIVTYIDSHASQLKGGGYEVFLLMEYCAGGGLIDFMNTRLQHRLTEPEIMKIISDVAEGVACLHYLKPPLLHRDLKVENVLISTSGTSKLYKICDFGSAANSRPAAMSAAEGRLLEDDIQRHTTLQYRSPEMVDVYRGQPIDEKSDIWALGVLLYKLCYYTTPFEDQGQMAILNATFRYPSAPSFSNQVKKLIAWMLQEQPHLRPNIYQVIKEICLIRGTKVPIEDIYSCSSKTGVDECRTTSSTQMPTTAPVAVGIQKTSPLPQSSKIPDVTRMRRGRPVNKAPETSILSKGSDVANSDPFAALDSTSDPVRIAAVDELASRFPSLDEFSLLHDKGSNFQFSRAGNPIAGQPQVKEQAKERAIDTLADKAFAKPLAFAAMNTSTSSHTQQIPKSSNTTDNYLRIQSSRESRILPSNPKQAQMVSTGTMTSQHPIIPTSQYPDSNHNYPSDQSIMAPINGIDRSQMGNPIGLLKQDSEPDILKQRRPQLFDLHRSKSYISASLTLKSPSSSRPSLEGKRPTETYFKEPISRSHSANPKMRPSIVHLNSSVEYLRDRESTNSRNSLALPHFDPSKEAIPSNRASVSNLENVERNINSDIEFLRIIEDDESIKKISRQPGHRRSTKRSSLPASLSNTKNLLAGKFGDAFRRFESNNVGGQPHTTENNTRRAKEVLPFFTDSVNADNNTERVIGIDETEDNVPEVRRELERMQMNLEEKRVGDAAAAYRQRADDQKVNTKYSSANKASTIQNRVKSLLQDNDDENAQSSSSGRKAGSTPPKASKLLRPLDHPSSVVKGSPNMSATSKHTSTEIIKPKPPPSEYKPSKGLPEKVSRSPAPRALPRPNAPPKPEALRTGSQTSLLARSGTSLAELQRKPPVKPPALNERDRAAEDWEANFNKRYPSLSGLDMVEMEVGKVPVLALHAEDR